MRGVLDTVGCSVVPLVSPSNQIPPAPPLPSVTTQMSPDISKGPWGGQDHCWSGLALMTLPECSTHSQYQLGHFYSAPQMCNRNHFKAPARVGVGDILKDLK